MDTRYRCRRYSLAPVGWYCKRPVHIDGPCALVPKWWNIPGRLAYRAR